MAALGPFLIPKTRAAKPTIPKVVTDVTALKPISPVRSPVPKAATIVIAEEPTIASSNKSRKKAKVSHDTKKDTLVENFTAYKERTTNRSRSVHIASHCCCMVCIVDEMKGEVRSEDMKVCYESKKIHRHLNVTAMLGGG